MTRTTNARVAGFAWGQPHQQIALFLVEDPDEVLVSREEGLVLALAGLYGLMAYNVARRTREIGIRIAIGAQSSDVLRLVMGKGFALVAAGGLIGLALGLAIEQLMNSMLFDAGGVDLLVYAAVVPAMLVVTMLAAWIPARRACRIPPTLALRAE